MSDAGPGPALHSRSPRATGGGGAQGGIRVGWRRRLRKPAVVGVRVGPLISMYGWRLRRHGLQELLAGVGVAIGVALVFGVLVASQSITSSANSILHDIIGSARLQVAARSPEGFSESLVERIGQLPGVRVAAPLLRANGEIVGPTGRHAVLLVGTTASELDLEGQATRYLGSEHLGHAVALTSSLANEIGATSNDNVTVLARGRTETLPVHTVWDTQQVRALANGALVITPLSVAQALLALPHRVSQVLIEPDRGAEAQVRAELTHLAGNRLNVQPATHELAVLDATAKPTTESSRLFAAIGAIVGFLFAVNAILLTVPERRRWVAEARMQGYSGGQVVAILGFQALTLGLLASAVGVLGGYALAKALFTAVPGYLTLSFPIGTQPIIAVSTIAVAVVAGVVATVLASVAPLRDLTPGRPIDAVIHGTGKVGHSISTATMLASGALAVGILATAVLLAVISPSLSIVAVTMLALGAICAVPALLVIAVDALMPAAERMRRSMLAIALAEVKGTATRSVALAGVAALAAYGSVAVVGAREDLIRGLNAATVQFLNTADVWVSPAGNNPFLSDSFSPEDAQREILQTPGIASVRTYQGAFLDIGTSRLWIRARPSEAVVMVPPSQLIKGNDAHASALIRSGGWATVSSGFAAEHHLGLGSGFTLPVPAGTMPLRVAAITTNSGSPAGAIMMSDREYQRWWQTSDPMALEVTVKSGVSDAAAKLAVARTLSGRQGLQVQTLAEREAQNERDERQGVQSLSEISRLVLIAAALAIAFALAATIAARRADLSSRKAEGYQPSQLWRVLLLESGVTIGVGALNGAALGLGGHALAGRWLRLTRGFPAPFSLDLAQLLLVLAIIAAVVLAVIAVAGYLATRVPPRLSLQE